MEAQARLTVPDMASIHMKRTEMTQTQTDGAHLFVLVYV